jgi:hypothetical protein
MYIAIQSVVRARFFVPCPEMLSWPNVARVSLAVQGACEAPQAPHLFGRGPWVRR